MNISTLLKELSSNNYDKSIVNTYFCINCGKEYFNNLSPVQTNTFTKCPSCKNDIYIPPKVELIDEWYIWYLKINQLTLYHFTDKANEESIIKYGGLYSWKYLEAHNILIAKPGGNETSRSLDQNKNLQDYVRLSFNNKPPMLYTAQRDGRIKDPIIFPIDPLAILIKGNKFSNNNATANNAIISSSISELLNYDLKLAMKGCYKNEDEKKIVQAEVLVKTHIPLSFLIPRKFS